MAGLLQSDAREVRHVSAAARDAGQRIDNFLLRCLKGVPRTHIYRLLRTGQVRVNRGRVKPGYRLRCGDSVRLPPVATARRNPRAGPTRRQLARLDGRIVYEDGQVLVIDKPAGMAVHGGSGVSYGVIETLRARRAGSPFLELVHRLDRDTSGCLMLAKRRSALRALHAELRAGRVEKRYLALLIGALPASGLKLDLALIKNRLRSGERMVTVAAEGKPAHTQLMPLANFPGVTLAEVRITTGRTHQIRVHAAHAGVPVAGDEKYGDREANKRLRALGLRRLFLHAHSINVALPNREQPLRVNAPLASELQRVLDALECFGGE
jgi:23S rRNA pseudouridine955/2504/2580 synthase